MYTITVWFTHGGYADSMQRDSMLTTGAGRVCVGQAGRTAVVGEVGRRLQVRAPVRVPEHHAGLRGGHCDIRVAVMITLGLLSLRRTK
jgi:hypothetical protein